MGSAVRLTWALKDRGFSVAAERGGTMALQGAGGSVEVDGSTLHLADAEVSASAPGAESGPMTEFRFIAADLVWWWEAVPDGAAIELTATLRNAGAHPVAIGDWNVLDLHAGDGAAVRVGADPDNVRFFAWHPWDMRVELLAAGWHRSDNLCHLFDPSTGEALVCGFVTVDRMVGRHSLLYGVCPSGASAPPPTDSVEGGGDGPRTEPEATVLGRREAGAGVAEYRATCEAGGVELPPGASITSERLRVGIFDDPYDALMDWAEAVHRIYRPAYADDPPVGWCGGAWIDAFSAEEDCWETVALDNADALRRKLPGFDVRYLWTSQTNFTDGIPGDWLRADERQIPSGLEGFFAKLAERGFVPGLWVAPFWFFAEAEGALEENRENLLKDRSGEPICERRSWEFDLHSDPDDAPRLHQYFLDGTHPQTAAHVRRIFAAYRELGVRYYMLDFLAVKQDARLHDPTRTPLQAARSILQVIRDAAGPDTHLQTAVSSTPGYVGLIDAARVGRDFGEGRPLFPPYNNWRNAVYALHDRHFGSIEYLVQNAAASFFTHRRTYLNDFNLLTVDKPVPLEHARVAATVFGLGGSPLMLGDDYRRIDPERLRLVKLCLPRTRGVPVPVDLFDDVRRGRVHPDGYARMLKLEIDTGWDEYTLVAVFNMDVEAYATDVSFARLGLATGSAYRVYELWNEEYRGTFRNRFRAVVPPSACRLYRIARARPYPWLLGTDLHVQQGAAEITSLSWDEASMTLTGTATRPAGERGNLFFLMPRAMSLINHTESFLMKEVLDMNVVIRRPVHFSAEREAFELRFRPRGTPYVSRKGWLPYTTEREWLEYAERHRAPDDPRVFE